MSKRVVAALTVVVLLWPNLGFAQETGEVPLQLSLRDSVALAVANSLDVRLAELDRMIARTQNQAALAPFDPEVTADLHYELDQAENSSAVLGDRRTETVFDIGVEKKFQTGTTLSSNFTNERSSTNSAFSNLNPAFATAWEIGITQAMVRNAGGLMDQAKVTLARLEVENQDLEAVDRVEGVIAEVSKAYWDLVFAREEVGINQRALEWAQALDQANQDQFQLGLIEEPEMLHSAANVHRREEGLLVVENQAASALERFKLLLSERQTIQIEPTETLAFVSHAVQTQESLQRAFGQRRDLRSARRDIRAKRVKLKMSESGLLPSVDLVASFRANGLDQKYGPALNKVLQADDPTYFIGIKASWKIGDKAAQSDFEAAQLEKAQALVTLAFLERTIFQEVDDAVRSVLQWEALVESRESVEELYRRRLLLQERRFALGRSNVTTLIEFQEDLLEAEELKVEAIIRHHQAWVDLKRTENHLLALHGLESL